MVAKGKEVRLRSRSARPRPLRALAIVAATLAVVGLLLAACRGGGESGDSGEQGESMATPAVAAQVPAGATAASPVLLAELTAPDATAGPGNAAWATGHLSNATTSGQG